MGRKEGNDRRIMLVLDNMLAFYWGIIYIMGTYYESLQFLMNSKSQ